LQTRRAILAEASHLATFDDGRAPETPLLAELVGSIREALDESQAWRAAGPASLPMSPLSFCQLEESSGRWSTPGSHLDRKAIADGLTIEGYELRDHLERDETNNRLINAIQLLPLMEVIASGSGVLSAGKGLKREDAVTGALAEAVERKLAQDPPPNHVFVASADELERLGFAVPSVDAGFRDAYTPQTRIDWVPALTLSGARAAVPAELAYYSYEPRSGVRAFDVQHTVGLASGTSASEAVWAGLAECLERDAYWIVMRCRARTPTLDVSVLGQDYQHVAHLAAQAGLRLILKDFSLDWPLKIVHAALVDESGHIPALAHGVGSHTTIRRAAERALAECVQLHADLVRYCATNLSDSVLPYANRTGTKSPPGSWADPASLHLFSHLVDTGEADYASQPCGEPRTLREIVELVGTIAGPMFWTELGAWQGLHVVRVLIPGCVPPDHEGHRVVPRLRWWLDRLGIRFPYQLPMLT
jgi:thiazole/oxazole-forming peptide maturase SagD family component